VWALVGLLGFLSLGGFAGGVPMVLDPTGAGLGLDPAWLERTPVGDYLLPGVFVLGVYGLGATTAAIGLVSRWSPGPLRRLDRRSGRHWSWWLTVAIGAALVGWIAYEYAVLPERIWLMPALLVTGALLLALAALPTTRAYVATRRGR
jgi:hypothetical protein